MISVHPLSQFVLPTNDLTDCKKCSGIGYTKPTTEETVACSCYISEKHEEFAPPGSKWSGVRHPQVLVCNGEKVTWADEEIADLILELWNSGIDTYVSCQGSPLSFTNRHLDGYIGVDGRYWADALTITGRYGRIYEIEFRTLKYPFLNRAMIIRFVRHEIFSEEDWKLRNRPNTMIYRDTDGTAYSWTNPYQSWDYGAVWWPPTMGMAGKVGVPFVPNSSSAWKRLEEGPELTE